MSDSTICKLEAKCLSFVFIPWVSLVSSCAYVLKNLCGHLALAIPQVFVWSDGLQQHWIQLENMWLWDAQWWTSGHTGVGPHARSSRISNVATFRATALRFPLQHRCYDKFWCGPRFLQNHGTIRWPMNLAWKLQHKLFFITVSRSQEDHNCTSIGNIHSKEANRHRNESMNQPHAAGSHTWPSVHHQDYVEEAKLQKEAVLLHSFLWFHNVSSHVAHSLPFLHFPNASKLWPFLCRNTFLKFNTWSYNRSKWTFQFAFTLKVQSALARDDLVVLTQDLKGIN